MQALPTEEAVPGSRQVTSSISFQEALPQFLSYLESYRSYSPLTVQSYRCDLRQFQEHLEKQLGGLPGPGEITREQVIHYAVSLSGSAPLTVRRKLACLSSFFGFLADMGYLPKRRMGQELPLQELLRVSCDCPNWEIG